jgi:hypothetical protein
MGLLVHRYRDRFASSASFADNAAAGQVVDLAVVHAEQFAADLAGARSPRVPGAAFPAGSQAYGAATDSAGSSPSIEIADALLGLAVYGSGCPLLGHRRARPHLSSSRAITSCWIWLVPS